MFKVDFCNVSPPMPSRHPLQRSQSCKTQSKESPDGTKRSWLDRVVMCLPVYTCCAEHLLTCTAGTDRQSHDNPARKTTSQWASPLWLEHLHQGTSGSQSIASRAKNRGTASMTGLYNLLKATQKQTVPTPIKPTTELFFTVLCIVLLS